MATELLERPEPIAPTEDESREAQETARRLAPYLGGPLRVQILGDGHPQDIVSIPASALRLLARILTEMAEGNALTLIPIHAELTTQQAADLLGVSRPFVVKRIEGGEIPSRRVGTHRRVRFQDVMEYKHRTDAARRKTLEALAAQAQELDMGY